jgi:hypothetical protein
MNIKPFTSLKISGDSAIASLMQQRNSFPHLDDYPFLIVPMGNTLGGMLNDGIG